MLYHRLRAILTATFIILLLTVCDDLGQALDDSAYDAPTAVLWAKPYWAKTVWQYPGPAGCPAGTFGYTADRLYCGACPSDYTWLGNADPDFCYKCEPGYTFASFPDDYYCYQCPEGYSIEPSGNTYMCFPPD